MPKPKSSRRDKTQGTVDRIAGRVLETISRLTGKRSTNGVKRRAAR